MLKPINGNILIEVEKPDDKTESGILLVMKDDVRLEKAKVISVAPDVTEIKKGQTIYYKLYSLSTIEIDKKEYAFIKYDEILAVE